MGDLNARMSAFGPTNSLGKSLERWLRTEKGVVLNNPNNPTFFRFKMDESGAKVLQISSTLDLIITNDQMKNKSNGAEVLISSPVTNDSFHNPIIAEFEIEPCKKNPGIRFMHPSYMTKLIGKTLSKRSMR